MVRVIFRTLAIAALVLAALASIPAAMVSFAAFYVSGLGGADGFLLRIISILSLVIGPLLLVALLAIQYLRSSRYWYAVSSIVLILFYILLFLNYFLPTFFQPA